MIKRLLQICSLGWMVSCDALLRSPTTTKFPSSGELRCKRHRLEQAKRKEDSLAVSCAIELETADGSTREPVSFQSRWNEQRQGCTSSRRRDRPLSNPAD